ncbi:protein MENT [Tachyglossus aculeatus]|uniref:protein MENT n=1 Tax=Tachyglossus aculeatus TaxID=9261 RepID=UPI0018F7223D|nr:protein MENT [Tachyglossus aculeatus]
MAPPPLLLLLLLVPGWAGSEPHRHPTIPPAWRAEAPDPVEEDAEAVADRLAAPAAAELLSVSQASANANASPAGAPAAPRPPPPPPPPAPPALELRLQLHPWGAWQCHCASGFMSRSRRVSLAPPTDVHVRPGALAHLRTERRPCTYQQCPGCSVAQAQCPQGAAQARGQGQGEAPPPWEPHPHPLAVEEAAAFWRRVRGSLEDVWAQLAALLGAGDGGTPQCPSPPPSLQA